MKPLISKVDKLDMVLLGIQTQSSFQYWLRLYHERHWAVLGTKDTGSVEAATHCHLLPSVITSSALHLEVCISVKVYFLFSSIWLLFLLTLREGAKTPEI